MPRASEVDAYDLFDSIHDQLIAAIAKGRVGMDLRCEDARCRHMSYSHNDAGARSCSKSGCPCCALKTPCVASGWNYARQLEDR